MPKKNIKKISVRLANPKVDTTFDGDGFINIWIDDNLKIYCQTSYPDPRRIISILDATKSFVQKSMDGTVFQENDYLN